MTTGPPARWRGLWVLAVLAALLLAGRAEALNALGAVRGASTAADSRSDWARSISLQQAALLQRLSWLDEQVNETLVQAQLYTKVAEQAAAAAQDTDIRGSNISEAIATAARAEDVANATLQDVLASVNNTGAVLANMSGNLTRLPDIPGWQNAIAVFRVDDAVQLDQKAVAGVRSVANQVDDNRRSLGLLQPRIDNIRSRVVALEGRLQGGNVSNVVSDMTDRSIIDIFKDLNRGLSRVLPG